MEKPLALVGAVDIGGTKIAVGLVDASGQILEQEVSPTGQDQDFSYALTRTRAMLNRCLERRPGVHVLGVGVGCSGPVDPNTGVLGPNSFFPGWEGIPTLPALQDALGMSVAIENDADAAVLGETAWGAGQGAQNCLYVTVSTGIGCGMILDNRLYRGAGGAHPELGHIIIDAGLGSTCYCGARGCWESLAAGPALAGWYAAQAKERSMLLEQEPGAALDAALDARAICRLAEKGQPLAKVAVDREGYYLGLGLANLVSTFVPDVIVLGGGVMESWPLFERQVHATIAQSCGLVPYQRTELRRASLGARTGLAGAAQVWFYRYGGK